jgi:type II secretory pathway pseudopilin PulG
MQSRSMSFGPRIDPTAPAGEVQPQAVNDFRSGFTLAETLIALVLASFIFASLATVQASLSRFQFQALRRNLLQAQASYTIEVMQRELREATVLLAPPPVGSASTLTGFSNLNPIDQTSPIVHSLPRRYFHFCLSSEPSLYRYSGNWPIPAITCGGPSGASERLAGGPGIVVSFTAQHPTGMADLVDLDVSLDRPSTPESPRIEIKSRARARTQEPPR